MATTLALTLLLLAGGQTPTETTFTDAALGLSFTHPTTWTTVATPIPVAPKGKGNRFKLPGGKKKSGPVGPPEGMVTFAIPGAEGTAPTQLTIVRASFSDAPEKWQQIQADVNRNSRREVDRQWQQEILGVPLLLTKFGFSEDGVTKTGLTGLLYNAAPYKLLFRLVGPADGFDAAQYQFTQAMLTLRTTSDDLPTAQEPGKPIAPPVVPGPDTKHPIFEGAKKATLVAPLALNVAFGERKMLLRVPEGWTLSKVEADGAVLRHPDLKNPVTVKFYLSSTAPRATDALTALSNKTLDEFKTVDLREDSPGAPNKAGNPLLSIWRKGTKASGPAAALDAVVVSGDAYLLFSFDPTPGDGMRAERKIVQQMLDVVGFVPAP